MKSVVYLVLFTLSVCGLAYGEDKVVTAEKVSISDVEAYAKKIEGKYPKFEVIGIHQEGNTAEVYFKSTRIFATLFWSFFLDNTPLCRF